MKADLVGIYMDCNAPMVLENIGSESGQDATYVDNVDEAVHTAAEGKRTIFQLDGRMWQIERQEDGRYMWQRIEWECGVADDVAAILG